MNHSEDVAIFWDIENVHVPRDVPGYAFVHRLRDMAHEFGIIKTFNAYMDCTKTESLRLQTDLHASGVSIIHCPHDGRKEVVDKTMLVDVITYAQDDSASATLILITGDRDFAYAISVLRFRRHRIILLPNENASPILKHQASIILDYQQVIADLPHVQPSGGAPSRRSSTATRLQPSPRIPPMDSGVGLQGLPERNASVSTLASDTDRFNGRPRHTKHSRHSSVTLNNGPGTQPVHRTSFTSTVTEHPSSPPVPSPPRRAFPQSLDIRASTSQPSSTASSTLGTVKKDRSFPVIESSPQNPEPESCPWRVEASATMNEPHVGRRKRSNTIFSSACVPPVRQQTTTALKTINQSSRPIPGASQKHTTSTSTGVCPTFTLCSPKVQQLPPPKPSAESGPGISTTIVLPGPTSPKQVPQRYQALIQILEQHRAQGRLKCYSDELASELYQTTNLEELMGPVKKKFRKYVWQASRLGIVDRGESASRKWVSLNPEWYGARYVGQM